MSARRRVPPHGGATSDHSVAPVEASEPPYYVAVFTTVRTEDQSGYSETNARMEDLVKDVPGYLGMDHAQTPGGLGITVGYFRDADALAQWQTNEEHRAAQQRGRDEWYRSYTLHVAKVERSSGFTREFVKADVPESPAVD
ncbi:antibiotic biosynthesis monooxygenase family protein [Streptomyces nigra]|uniref:antibiotic biosynthesis monooxygenase family protein n=1 Tax=Streptomyces nigra TaxID=1827580 RepID=UPI0038083C70